MRMVGRRDGPTRPCAVARAYFDIRVWSAPLVLVNYVLVGWLVGLARTRAVNPAAYESYLRGMFHLEMITPQDMQLAEDLFSRALEIDRNSALATQPGCSQSQ